MSPAASHPAPELVQATPAGGLHDTGPSGPLADLVTSLFAHTTVMVVSNLLGAVVLIGLFADVVPAAVLGSWAAAFALLLSARVALALAWRRTAAVAAVAEASQRLWLWRWNVAALCSGALWGLAAWVFYGRGGVMHQISLLLIVYSFSLASIPMLASQIAVFVSFVALAFVPMILRIATAGEPHGHTLALTMTLIFGVTVLLGRNYRGALENVMRLKAHTQHLLEQLRLEKAAADAARREAEAANRAKTQFFAAASHDLRQPLHALGLFAEALRGKSHDVEVVQLVNSINASVDALEGLFSELLDITRIDTGGVEVRPVDFQLDDILRKLRLHFEPLAFEKGLALRIRGGRQVAHADPVLVDRILRNLVSNAIRYTEDGGVLVGVRRRGERLALQVWDSGLGIHPRDQERVFDEFMQINDATPTLAAHQRKGLGLGLSIVRRLAALLQAPLTLRSAPGRGTVFTLLLPVGRLPRPAEPARTGPRALGLSLDHRLIVVVEDDPAVKSGLEVLLKSWGASVMAFDSHDGFATWAAAAEPSQLRPDLLVTDYRLESGHTGLEVIELTRRVFDAKVPALVVTGSLMSSQEQLAHEQGFHLLLKPVVPHKLRAMIAFKLGLR